MKKYRKSQFNPAPDKCPKCRRKLKYDTHCPKHLISKLIQMEFDIKVSRRRIEGIADCKCTTWFKLK